MLILPGSSALPAFRQQQLLEFLPQVQAITAHYLYFVQTSAALSDDSKGHLVDLLCQQGSAEVDSEDNDLILVPRKGTQTPWSSQVTEVCHSAGFAEVSRVERGIAYQITLSEGGDMAPVVQEIGRASCREGGWRGV